MDKLEKVLKGIEICLHPGSCRECPYYRVYDTTIEKCAKEMMQDALELLKAQQKEIEKLTQARHSKVVCRDCGFTYDTALYKSDVTVYKCVHDGFYHFGDDCCGGGVPSWLNEPNGWERLTGEGEEEGEKEQKTEHSDSPEEDDG